MIEIAQHSIEWWAERLRKPLALARFGDGEFYCVQGRPGGNSHGCAYTPALRDDLMAIIEDEDPELLKGMQRIEGWQLTQVKPYLKGNWIDTEIFADSLAAGKLKPFFDALREKPLMLVSSAEKRKASEFLPIKYFVETPRTNAHAEKWSIINSIHEYNPVDMTVLFACGMAAGTFVRALYKQYPDASFIDIGHILDPFIGEASRDYLLDMDEEVLMQNIL